MEGLGLSWALVWPFRFLVSLCDRSFVSSAHWPSCQHSTQLRNLVTLGLCPELSWPRLGFPRSCEFPVSLKFCLFPWVRLFTSASWCEFVMIFTAAPRGRQASSYRSAASSVSRWSVMSHGRQGALSGTHLRSSFLCIYIILNLLRRGQFVLVGASRWCLLSMAGDPSKNLSSLDYVLSKLS